MKRIYLGKNERVVAVVPEDCAGPGWSNSVVWVYIRDYLGNTRSECLQIADQTPEMLTLFEHGAIMHRALVGAVPTVVGSGPADADFEALLAEQEPLGPEFEAVWDANRETLYEP